MSQPVVTVEDQQSSIQQGISAVEENQQQQQVQQQEQQPHADVGPNMPQPTQRSNTVNQIPTEAELEQQGNNTEAQANNLGFSAVPPQQQQAVSATTSQGVTAPKPKVDHTQTDATIQGLLVQVIALQHNKIQQIASQQNQE
jgi:hypothetical protein